MRDTRCKAIRAQPTVRESAVCPTTHVSCTLAIKAITHAPRSAVCGWLGDALKVNIHAPPVEGRANQVLCEFLADELGLSCRSFTLLRGDTSRQKVLRIDGLSDAIDSSEGWADDRRSFVKQRISYWLEWAKLSDQGWITGGEE